MSDTSTTHEYISAPNFSFWAAREAALADLKALPALCDRIYDEWRKGRMEQSKGSRAALTMKLTHREQAVAELLKAYDLETR